MRKFNRFFFIGTLAVSIALLVGCSETKVPSNNITKPTAQEMFVLTTEPTVQEQTPATFDYKPGSMNTYLTVAPNQEVPASVLDSLKMTLPEGVSRCPVSSTQLDFVKDGKQIGGILVVDISHEMRKKAAESEEGLQTMADYVAKQVMSGIYPELTHLNGGGKGIKGEYARFFVEANDRRTQYKHCIYLGEQYCYDFWTDQSWWDDSGYGIQDSLSSSDIKPENNQIEFSWPN